MSAIAYSAPTDSVLAALLRSDAFARVIKGPVGSGKSSACIVEIGRRAIQQAPDAEGVRRTRFAVIRNTYRELRDTTRRTFEQWMPVGKWREADFAFELKAPLGDGTRVDCEVLFRSLNRPEDVKKLLSLELTGAYVNEVKEIPKRVIDVLETRIGRFPSAAQGGPTWFGWWGDTNPWHMGHWGYKLFKNPPPGYLLLQQPGGRSERAENVENLVPGYYQRLCHGKDSDWIRVFIDGEDAQSAQGAILGALIDKLEMAGGLANFDHPKDGVFCSWDLGFTDSTAIWFWRLNKDGGVDFVDHYEAHGQPLSHYFDAVEATGYGIVKHWLPHDAAARTLASAVSVQDQFLARYPGRVDIGPALSLLDGIQAGRWLLEQPCRFHPRTEQGIEALRAYHYEWDDEAKTYSRKPEHDWSSHCFAGETEVLTRYGTQRIMDLPFDGEVLTPCGWKPYRNPRMSKRSAPLVAVEFADGSTYRCTPDHLFLTENGWLSAERLRPTLPIRSCLTRSRSISMAASTVCGLAKTIFRAAGSACIEMFGSQHSAPFLSVATSTTETATPATIDWPTSNACQQRSTERSHAPTQHQSPAPQETQQRRGTGQRPDAFGISAMRSVPRAGQNGSGFQSLVLGAASRLWRWCVRADTHKNTAQRFARPLRIVAVKPLAETADVWDLTVPDGECFSLANGAVVHNSADAFRYAALVAKHVMRVSRKPPEPGPPIIPPIDRAFNLDQLFADNEARQPRRERI